jgi:WD40 repeat protein
MTGRCLQSVQTHYQDLSIIRCNEDFLATGSSDGQIGIFATRHLLDIHQTVRPLAIINAHTLPITDLYLANDLIFSSSTDFTVKVS